MGHYWILFLPLSSLYILAFHGVLRRNIEHREKNKKNLQYIVLPIFCVLFEIEIEIERERGREREGGTETQMDLFLSAVLGDLASRSILYYDACIDAYDA